eukprot:scaffold29154_cov53-Attheya_sp.AAC.1
MVNITSVPSSVNPLVFGAFPNANHDPRQNYGGYKEEIDGLQRLGTYEEINYAAYKALRAKGAPKALPSMCVQTVKKDEDFNPDRAKSRIVIIGNHEARYWSNADKYAPVLSQLGLRLLTSMAVQHKRRLKQGDCKNAFCQATLPDDEPTIIHPPASCPFTKPGMF